jgi:hypothetical protein
VTAVERIDGRAITTAEGLDPSRRDALASGFLEAGGSQCGFCTPGIAVRAAALLDKGRTSRAHVDRALAAHLCRCTGWQTVYDAIARASESATSTTRNLEAASRRAALEGGDPQHVSSDVPLGAGGFADDTAPRDALVALPAGPGATDDVIEAGGMRWVVAESLEEARSHAGKVQGRRTTVDDEPPLPLSDLPDGGVRLATGWVEPAYLEPDASWCEPGGEPATPLANGGAFGGKRTSPVPAVARELADRFGRTVRVLFSREDVVRFGPKRPPMSATASFADGVVDLRGVVAGAAEPFAELVDWPYRINEAQSWVRIDVPGPPTSEDARAAGLAERAVLLEGALAEAGADRGALLLDDRAHAVSLDTCAPAPSGALAGARVKIGTSSGAVERVEVRVAAGDPLDEVVLRSYCIGAAHMALGWVLSEGLAVDPETGEPLDLTIRSFGVIRAKSTPPIDVTIIDDSGEPRARASDAVFAAVAAATWNAVAAAEGTRPETFPARGTRAARRLRA